ncbi:MULTISPECIES: SEC-C domain-containing protein [Methanobacterium]|uniref:SEC-C domain-containing protein n=1 Tax=Methanobacterium veterum TaxID=408577 RepID=A0A9E5A1V3_9EURY|nr:MULTISPECIES: SEC-C domain-containing protein [Methanobacterium]MCZ3366530.1 SEC-C domain-containing protein [Methanobacterium veterum]MCZ3371761.1 SEC-C domain-containing protein [Methanobacterium veterum]
MSKSNNSSKRTIEYEIVDDGLAMSSKMEPEEFEEFIKDIKSKRPEIKEKIDENIQKVSAIIKEYDPFILLQSITLANFLTNMEKYSEFTHPGKEIYVEYALSLILGHSKFNIGINTPKNKIEEFITLINEILNDVTLYFATETVEGKTDEIEGKIRFMSLTSYLFLRGDSYKKHHLELVKDLFKPHDSFLKENFDLTTDEIIEGINEIGSQLLKNSNNQQEFWVKVGELQELFRDFIEQDENKNLSIEDIKKNYNNLPEVLKKRKELDALKRKTEKFPFIVEPNDKIPKKLLKLLSSHFGENIPFTSFKKGPCWPTNDSIIQERPIIEYNDDFYCFIPNILFRNTINIIEAWIKEKDESYFENNYKTKSGECLEIKALEYFKTIFPDAEIYNKLFYYITENGERKRPETDGIVIYDNNLFIIEAKGGSFSISARRGSIRALKNDATELIDKAYSQALRTKKYIEESEEPVFEDERGSEILVIKDKKRFKNIYLINITLENLGYISINLNLLKSIDLIQGKEWPWSVFINDLRIISEIVEFPSEFILFLQQRTILNNYAQIKASDELDLFMCFLDRQLDFDDKTLEHYDEIEIPTTYTEPLDRYYNYLDGQVSTGEKPQIDIPKEYEEIVKGVEKVNKKDFTSISTLLLGFNAEIQHIILENIQNIVDDLKINENYNYYFTICIDKPTIGLTIIITTHDNYNPHDVDYYCKMKMYKHKLEEWVLLNISLQEEKVIVKDFKNYKQKWRHDYRKNNQLKRFKGLNFAGFRTMGKKLENNDLCPCGSGKKYKKCCK